MIVLHGTVLSPYVRKVRVFCLEKGIPFETTELAPARDGDRVRKMSPVGKIPILEEAGRFVPDSSVICAYLERVHRSPALYPTEPKSYARALFLEEWSDTLGLDVFHPALVERVILPRLFGKRGDEERVARARVDTAPPAFDWLESQLDEGSTGFVEGRFSVADCALGAQLQSWDLAGETIDATRWPKLHACAEALVARPSFAAMREAVAAAD